MNAALLLEHYARIADAPDAIARLRRFVLDLAARGKLVEQDPRDEPAPDLLERIKATAPASPMRRGRSRDTSAGNVLEGVPFEAPKGWTFARLGELSRKLINRDHLSLHALICCRLSVRRKLSQRTQPKVALKR